MNEVDTKRQRKRREERKKKEESYRQKRRKMIMLWGGHRVEASVWGLAAKRRFGVIVESGV